MPHEPIEKPDYDEVRERKLQQRLEKLRDKASSVRVDGRNVTANSDTLDEAKKLNKLPNDVIAKFEQTMDDAMREMEFRREVWENPLTRPQKRSDLPVHPVIDIDTILGWVEIGRWQHCGGDCPENEDLRKKL